MKLVIHTDGGSRGNPGPAAGGIVITDAADGQPIFEGAFFFGRMTNNLAEYLALQKALELIQSMDVEAVTCIADSQLMVMQLTGQYKVKSDKLKPVFEKVRSLLNQFPTWEAKHVKRDRNSHADDLANKAMDAKRDVVITNDLDWLAEGNAKAAKQKQPEMREESTATEDQIDTSASEQGLTQYRATVTHPAGKSCPRQQAMQEGSVFTFGPTLPGECCLGAGQAVMLNLVDADRETEPAVCLVCGCEIAIEKVN